MKKPQAAKAKTTSTYTARLPRSSTSGVTSTEVNRALRSCREVFEAIDVVVECMRKHERITSSDVLEVVAQFSQKGTWTDHQLLAIYRRANPGVLVGVQGSGLFKNGPPPKVSGKRPPVVSFTIKGLMHQQQRMLRAKGRASARKAA